LKFYCDDKRHLICIPYTIDNLHAMADQLSIKRCWFHSSKYPHYDVPKKMIDSIKAQVEVVSSKDLLRLINKSKGV